MVGSIGTVWKTPISVKTLSDKLIQRPTAPAQTSISEGPPATISSSKIGSTVASRAVLCLSSHNKSDHPHHDECNRKFLFHWQITDRLKNYQGSVWSWMCQMNGPRPLPLLLIDLLTVRP